MLWGIQSLQRKNAIVPVHAMKAYKGSRSITPLILILRSRLRCVVNFTTPTISPRNSTTVLIE
jgi:hypothetical protein